MRDHDQDNLVVDVAGALTLHQEVQWDRCERLATPANRWVLPSLRAFSCIIEIVGCPPGPRNILRTDPDLG